VCVCLSLYIFSHICAAVLCVRVSVHLPSAKQKQLHSYVNTQAHAWHGFFLSSSFFFSTSLILFLYLLFFAVFGFYFSLCLFSAHIHFKEKSAAKNNERNYKKTIIHCFWPFHRSPIFRNRLVVVRQWTSRDGSVFQVLKLTRKTGIELIYNMMSKRKQSIQSTRLSSSCNYAWFEC
jgi:hypothetical protein